MGSKFSSLNCSAGNTDANDSLPYSQQLVIEHNVGKTEHRGLSPIAPDVLPLEAAQFARDKRLSKRSSCPSSPQSVSNNNELALKSSEVGSQSANMFTFCDQSEVTVSSAAENSSTRDGYRKDNIYCNIPNKKFALPLPPLPSQPTQQPDNKHSAADLIPEEEPTPPTLRRNPPLSPTLLDSAAISPKLPPRPKHLSLLKTPISHGSSTESVICSPPPRKTVEFASSDSSNIRPIDSLQDCSKDGGEMQHSISPPQSPGVVKKRPRKPPRNYSYKASTLPKRISHTTEEVMELWDEVRKALSLEKMQNCIQNDITEEDDDIDEIYQNLYAARMRSWQIMCLAQDVIVDVLIPDDVWKYFVDESLLNDEDYISLNLSSLSRVESSQLMIDRILEQGDGHFDKLREFLREQNDQKEISNLLETLNQIFIIGAKANKWTFSLTTKHCTVGYARVNVNSKPPDLIGDTNEPPKPVVNLEVYDENFGNSSCAALAEVLNKFGVISQLNLGKNRITSKGLMRLVDKLESNRTLEKLNLRLNPIENDGLDILERALNGNQSVKELVLCHTNLQAGCGKSIASLLINSTSLQALDLSYNEISDGDCRNIQKGLFQNSSLRSLHLRGNQISSRGCEYLCAGLQKNSRVELLDLSHNNIQDDGAKSIAMLLLKKTSLQELLMENCGLQRVGCTLLAGALKSNTSIQCLYLNNNPIGDLGASDLSEMMRSNKTLRTLYLNLCGLTRVGLLKLLAVMSQDNISMKMLGACYNDLLLNEDSYLQDNVSALEVRQILNAIVEKDADRKILTWGRSFT